MEEQSKGEGLTKRMICLAKVSKYNVVDATPFGRFPVAAIEILDGLAKGV